MQWAPEVNKNAEVQRGVPMANRSTNTDIMSHEGKHMLDRDNRAIPSRASQQVDGTRYASPSETGGVNTENINRWRTNRPTRTSHGPLPIAPGQAVPPSLYQPNRRPRG